MWWKIASITMNHHTDEVLAVAAVVLILHFSVEEDSTVFYSFSLLPSVFEEFNPLYVFGIHQNVFDSGYSSTSPLISMDPCRIGY